MDWGMRGGLGHRIYGTLFTRPRKGISHEIGLSLHVTDVGGKLRDEGQLVLLPYRLRIRFLVDGRNKALMIGKQGERPALDHRLEMPY